MTIATQAISDSPAVAVPPAAVPPGMRARRPGTLGVPLGPPRWMRARRYGDVGIDVGRRWTKVAQMEFAGGELRVRATDVFETGSRRTNRGMELPPEFARTLRRRIRAGGFRPAPIACVLPADVYEFHIVELAAEDLALSPAAFRRHIDAARPGRRDGCEFDFWPISGELLGAGKLPGAAAVLSLATDLLQGVVRAMSRNGLDLHVLDGPQPLLARTVQLDSAAAAGCLAVVDWDSHTATLTLVNRGVAVFSRRLRDAGYSTFVDAIADGLSVSHREAECLLQKYGIEGSPPAGELAALVAAPLHNLREELERTLAYARRKHFELHPTELILVGDGAALRTAAAVWTNAPHPPGDQGGVSGVLTTRLWEPPPGVSCVDPTVPSAMFAKALALSTRSLDLPA